MAENTNTTAPVKKSSLSTAGFVCSLCGFVTCGITSIIGLILSIIGLSQSKKNGQSDGLAIAGIVIGALPLVGVLLILATGGTSSLNTTDDGKQQSGEKSKTTERTYMQVTVDDLEDALENNAAAAKDTYKGQYVEVTGKLGTIDSDLKYIGLDSLTKEWDLVGIHCNIKNSETKDIVKTLTKDQTIIVKGKITDVGEVLGYYLDIEEIIPQ